MKNPFLNLKQWQKQAVALIATVVSISLVAGIWSLSTNQGLRDRFFGKKTDQTEVVKKQDTETAAFLQKFNETLKGFNPDTVLYKEVSLEDLPIYPKIWVDRYFSPEEQVNALISGEAADGDGDGLSNKQEYLYGSNPRVTDTLCENRLDKNIQCSGRNDKQNVDANISPLTGLSLDTPKKFQIKQQDFAFISQLKDSLTEAANEGVDFPTLYQEARLVNLRSEIPSFDIQGVDNNRQTVLDYLSNRLKVLDGFVSNDALGSFSKVYSYTKVEEFDKAITQYQDIKTQLKSAPVPKKYLDSQRAYLFLFDKLLDLLAHRKTIIGQPVPTEEFKKLSKQKSVAMAWAYQNLNEELTKVNPEE
jgi:hypothetical protein